MKRRWSKMRSLSVRQWCVVTASVLLLPFVQLSLHARGFRPTADTLARRSDRPFRSDDLAEARLVAEAVTLVSHRRVVGARCLGRSLLTWFLVRRGGIDAQLVIGAAGRDSAGSLPAHAWVEVEGEPINDRADVRETYGSFGLALPSLPRGASPAIKAE